MNAPAISHEPFMHPAVRLVLPDEAATALLGEILAKLLVTGDLVRLQGDLGAGKSTLARAMIMALGHTAEVPSPTFGLVQTYADTRVPVAHVDCYRLESTDQLATLGLEDYVRHGVLLAEWPDKGGPWLSADRPDVLQYHIAEMNNPGVLTLELQPGPNSTSRVVTLRGSRSWQRRWGFLERQGLPTAWLQPPLVLRRGGDAAAQLSFATSVLGPGVQLENLGGDWSARSYWRVRKPDGSSAMLMDAPPPVEGVQEFATVARYYSSVGLRVPTILGLDAAQGYLLSEDFGDLSLVKAVAAGADQAAWYGVAVDVLTTLCAAAVPADMRRYNATDWWVEVARFTDWYVPLARGYATTPEERATWQALWAPWYELVNTLPQGLMPWDYQATNMLVLGEKPELQNFGLIDIQDARVAPVAQDLAILLRDIRRNQDDALERAMLQRAAATLGLELATLQRGVAVASLHHCCRILGGLARLAVRDGRSAGAKRFMARTWEVAAQSFELPELREIVDFMLPYRAPGLAATERLA